MLIACGPTGKTLRPHSFMDEPQAKQAASLFSNQYYADAATLYRQLADSAPPQLRNIMLLMSAESLLRDHQTEALQNTLSIINNSTLNADDLLRYQLLQAEIALGNGQPEQTLEILQSPLDPSRPVDLKQRYYNDKAQAYQLLNQLPEQVLELEQLDLLLKNRDTKLLTQLDILNSLSRFSGLQLQQLAGAKTPLHQGWVELSQIARGYRHNPQLMLAPYREWQDLFPDHPALPELLNNYLSQQSAQLLNVEKIAVLLPDTGKYAAAAAALRNGFMTAWYAASAQDRPEVRFYDASNSEAIWPTINQAADDGANIIVGPLAKASVLQLARAGKLPVPVLTLNQVKTDNILPQDLYQYALSPEDEATQVADWAWSNGLRSPAILSPTSAKGNRLQEAFANRWNELTGDAVNLQNYSPSEKNYATAIQNMLALNLSEARHKRLQKLLGRNLEFTPRRRADTDFIFAIGNGNQLLQIKPLMQFYYASNLPLYSTSSAWNGTVSHQQSFDIKGLMLPDIPWLISEDTSPLSRTQINQQFPDSNGSYLRLYAMGQDAYRLVSDLRRLESSALETLDGATGVLHMDQNRHIHRQLTWITLDKNPSILGVTPRIDRALSHFEINDGADQNSTQE